MTQPLGIDDFFALEAGEYLERLATLASRAAAPNGDELVRFTRALRGSALMANYTPIARAASGLEHLVRSYRDGKRTWDTELAGLVREAIDVLRTLVERARSWSADDQARAERLSAQLEKVVGVGPKPITGPIPAVSESGTRAFLAREAAGLGSVLDQASRSLAGGSAGTEAIQSVLRRMQPLRGLAALADYPPLPDLLDGIERTVDALSRLELPADAAGERLGSAAAGLGRAARDIAERGRPDPNADEFRRFAGLLLAPERELPPIVPIESLFFEGDQGILHRGTPQRSATAGSLGAAAVVSRGEHLCQTADEIVEAGSAPQRDLRLHVLQSDLRTLAAGLPAGLDVAVEAFAVAARGAITRGMATDEPARFAGLIREAGARLRTFTEVTQPATLIRGFEELIRSVEKLTGDDERTEPRGRAASGPAASPRASAPGDVVPIEMLAPDADLAPTAADGWDIAASFSSYEALVAGLPPRTAAPLEEAVVGIETLLYQGRPALERANVVRREIRTAVAASTPMNTLRPLVDELLDLVELALAD
mgnify:FL=1